VRLIVDIFECYMSNDLDGVLLFLDFWKRLWFNRINFMYKVLENFNFGKNFMKMIKTFYNEPIFKIKKIMDGFQNQVPCKEKLDTVFRLITTFCICSR
jgi:hypothetical protein